MLIEQILRTKGGSVITIPASTSLQQAAQILDENRIGATVALDDTNTIVGVLSERDITRRVAREGGAALSMSVADAMTRDVITGSPTDSIESCMEQMTDRRIRHLPIVSGGDLIGIISIGDLVKWKIAETEAEAEAMKAYIATG